MTKNCGIDCGSPIATTKFIDRIASSHPNQCTIQSRLESRVVQLFKLLRLDSGRCYQSLLSPCGNLARIGENFPVWRGDEQKANISPVACVHLSVFCQEFFLFLASCLTQLPIFACPDAKSRASTLGLYSVAWIK